MRRQQDELYLESGFTPEEIERGRQAELAWQLDLQELEDELAFIDALGEGIE